MEFDGAIQKRGRALEDEFFHRVDQKLAAELKERIQREAQRKNLAQICGLKDEALLDKLVAAGVHAETLVALTLVPLIQVAWADGKLEEAERKAVIEAAEQHHCEAGTVAHDLLLSWLREPPPENLVEAWRDYVGLFSQSLSSEERAAFGSTMIDHARTVAKAAGGILGIGRISHSEEDALDEIARVFGD